MKHPGHTYGGFVPAILEWGMTFDFKNIGSKLEYFKKSQENLEFNQNKCHPEDVRDMRRQCSKATNQWAQGVADRLAYESVRTKTSSTPVCMRRQRLWRCNTLFFEKNRIL
jgi:hypothetical protein